jgi:hypothetical protein
VAPRERGSGSMASIIPYLITIKIIFYPQKKYIYTHNKTTKFASKVAKCFKNN